MVIPEDVLIFRDINITRVTLNCWVKLADSSWNLFVSYGEAQIACSIYEIRRRWDELRESSRNC